MIVCEIQQGRLGTAHTQLCLSPQQNVMAWLIIRGSDA